MVTESGRVGSVQISIQVKYRGTTKKEKKREGEGGVNYGWVVELLLYSTVPCCTVTYRAGTGCPTVLMVPPCGDYEYSQYRTESKQFII